MITLAVDPGVKKAGYAIFEDGELTEAGTVRGRTAFDTAAEIARRAGSPDVVYIEKMKKYAGRGSTHKDLTRVETMAKALTQTLRNRGAKVKRVYPGDWKGQLPKDVCERRLWAELTEHERDMFLDEGHDAIDAAAIGVVTTGRLKRGLV